MQLWYFLYLSCSVDKSKGKHHLHFMLFNVAYSPSINSLRAKWLTFTNLVGAGSFTGAEAVFRAARFESEAPDQ